MTNKDGRLSFVIVFALGVLLMGTAFLTINNTILKTSLKDASVLPWNITLSNIKKLSNNDSFDVNIDESRMNIIFDLDKPGKTYEYTIDVINNSAYNTIINGVDIEIPPIGTSDITKNTYYLSDYIDVKVSDINKGEKLYARGIKTIKVSIYVKNDLSIDEIYVLNTDKNTKKEMISINVDVQQA